MLAYRTFGSRDRDAARGIRAPLHARALNATWSMANACTRLHRAGAELLRDVRAALRDRRARRLELEQVTAEVRADLPRVVLEEGRDF